MFQTPAELSGNLIWSCYYKTVFGALPYTGFPICTSNLRYIYKHILTKCGGPGPGTVEKPYYAEQGGKWGDSSQCKYVDTVPDYAGHDFGGQLLNYGKPGMETAVPNNTWMELMHGEVPGGEESVGAWFFHATGSGVFVYTGKTWTGNGHEDAYQAFCDGCGDDPSCFAGARAQGIDTVQFLQGCCYPGTQDNFLMEFVDVTGCGTYACGNETSHWKTGWEVCAALLPGEGWVGGSVV